jgi:predicted nucleic acid-binding protein
MSAERVFVDTNVLRYAFDDAEPEKQERARTCLTSEQREIFVSTQVLQELYVSLTKGRDPIATTEVAEAAVRAATGYSVVQIDTTLVLSAIALSRAHQLSFWDVAPALSCPPSGSIASSPIWQTTGTTALPCRSLGSSPRLSAELSALAMTG